MKPKVEEWMIKAAEKICEGFDDRVGVKPVAQIIAEHAPEPCQHFWRTIPLLQKWSWFTECEKCRTGAPLDLQAEMAEEEQPQVGQVWQDWDIRFRTTRPSAGRLITVKRIAGEYAYCDSDGKTVRIKLSRFKPNSTGYKLVKP